MAMLGHSEGKFIEGMDGLEQGEGERGEGERERESGRGGKGEGEGERGRGKGNAVESLVLALENVRSH